ncbi:LacI family DNA-binding transcriptional regulator [Catenovulum sp. 2E275]|uniref:LacI family DNA-binding transcriptional regulator n=1 Tax=Catenovulum sp. 2E275 TaxID=2980497 RepID=UPI0021D0AFA4|nr:LacI family DNA-binding transcriptional regulator [Catenovulum sp. 2E275]MCU4675716.1 LacI family DNA-binding transcriptional regulator [Catenovulum sp. 2E275]
MSAKKPLTLKKVAEILNVSTATISNAFNRPDQLSVSLREKLLAECDRLGYHGPNIAARSLRKGESGVIAVLLTDSLAYHFTDPVANQFLQGISEVLEKNGKQLLMLSGAHGDAPSTGIEALPDGFIIYGTQDHNPLFERIIKQGKPIITVDFDVPELGSVNIDNVQAAYKIATHVMAQKVNHVAILGLRLIHSDRVCRITQGELYDESEAVSRRRLNGYIKALQEYNHQIAPDRIWHVPLNTLDAAYQAAKEALTISPRPDAIICMTDKLAIGVIEAAKELNIKIPEELKLVGFDDIPESALVNPPLTSVHQYIKQKGIRAAQRLLAGELETKEILDVDIVIRQSC